MNITSDNPRLLNDSKKDMLRKPAKCPLYPESWAFAPGPFVPLARLTLSLTLNLWRQMCGKIARWWRANVRICTYGVRAVLG